MKNLITILFLFAFTINAQIELSEDWSFKPDKEKHIIVASAMSITTYSLVYHKTKDEGLAFRASIIIPAFPIILWEGANMLNGKEISLSDMGYGLGSCIITSSLMYAGTKIRDNRKRKKLNKKLYDYDTWIYDFDNEIFINNK